MAVDVLSCPAIRKVATWFRMFPSGKSSPVSGSGSVNIRVAMSLTPFLANGQPPAAAGSASLGAGADAAPLNGHPPPSPSSLPKMLFFLSAMTALSSPSMAAMIFFIFLTSPVIKPATI